MFTSATVSGKMSGNLTVPWRVDPVARLCDVTVDFRPPKRKLWNDDKKWLHDRYDEHAQMPKTRQELMDVYGYDLRAASRPYGDGDGMMRRRGRPR